MGTRMPYDRTNITTSFPGTSLILQRERTFFLSHLKRLQSKQNTVLRLMFFATSSGPYTESAHPFLNLLDVLTVNNVYRLHALKFTHLWHKGHLPSLFDNLFQYASCRHTHNTRYASKQNFCNPENKMFSYQAIDLWRDIPYYLKDLNAFSFAKEIKHHLLSEQYSKKFE